MKILIYGKGYLGEHFFNYLKANGEKVVYGEADIGSLEEVRKDLTNHQTDIVLNCAGRTGRPNVDWCEDHKAETLYANVTGPLVLLQACIESWKKRESPTAPLLVHLGSGCVYEGDNGGKGFSETDPPNFEGSLYSQSKAWSERMLSEFPVLQLRLRMPVDANPGPRNFISKILKYEKVISMPNSLTVIEDLLPAAHELMKRRRTGIYNMTNPGTIDHQTILEMYKEIVDPTFTYQIIPLKELYAHHAKAKRSNCSLNTTKLQNEGIAMRPIEVAIRDCLGKGFKS